MAKLVTPVIGLAVVVALAMVAVFGAMSLADPAQADIASRPAPKVALTADTVVDPVTIPDYAGEAGVTYTITFTVEDHVLDDGGGNPEIEILLPSGVSRAVGVTLTRVTVTPGGNGTGTYSPPERGVPAKVVVTGVTLTTPAQPTQVVEVVVDQLINSKTAGEQTVQIFDGEDDTDGQEATFDITAVKVVETDGEFVVTYVAQEAYAGRSVLDVMLGDGYSFSFDEIAREDVNVDGSSPRGVELDESRGVISITLGSAVSKGRTVMIDFLESAGINSPDKNDDHLWTVDGNESSKDSTMIDTESAAEEEVTDLDSSFKPVSSKPGSNTRYDITFDVILPKAADGTMVDGDFNTLTDDIVIELEDFTVPSSIPESAIAVSLDQPAPENGDGRARKIQTTRPYPTRFRCPVRRLRSPLVTGTRTAPATTLRRTVRFRMVAQSP